MRNFGRFRARIFAKALSSMSNIPLIINGEVVHRGASRRQQTLGEDIRRKVLRGAGDEDDKRTLGQIASDLFLPYCTAKSAAFLGTWYACMYGMGELWPIGFMLGVIVAIFLGTRGADEGRQVRALPSVPAASSYEYYSLPARLRCLCRRAIELALREHTTSCAAGRALSVLSV